MSVNADGFGLHIVPREMLHDAPLVEAAQEIAFFPLPQGEANHLLVTATEENKIVGIARLDISPAQRWLAKVTFGVAPELNGHTSEVVAKMTYKLGEQAVRHGVTVLEVAERVKKRPGQDLERVDVNDSLQYGRSKAVRRVGL